MSAAARSSISTLRRDYEFDISAANAPPHARSASQRKLTPCRQKKPTKPFLTIRSSAECIVRDYWSLGDPAGAVETSHLHLRKRRIVVRSSRDRDSGKQH